VTIAELIEKLSGYDSSLNILVDIDDDSLVPLSAEVDEVTYVDGNIVLTVGL
jgi:hypothetical protein